MYKSPNPFDFGAESKICITFTLSTTMNSDSSPQYSPNKRFKTLTSPDPDNNSKGKSKISEDDNQNDDESADCCGICLSEAGNGGGGGGGVSRGYIDSCDHYFCFVCIMEWSKVESKCPLCKRRFSAIRRPPKPPVFASERVVRVPVRDQVYCHFGNATTGPPDPYSELKCGVCHSVADENLLLLCDLCDSGAHTYCVGLGMTVPEGDWFCQDCALVREENLKSEANTDSDFQVSFCTNDESSSINEQVSISDIVQEPFSDAVPRRRSTSSVACLLPPPAMTNNINRQGSRRRETIAQHPTKSNARTLQRCHDVQDHIRVLRENWNGFQNGTLRFPSSQGDGSNSRQMSGSCVSGHNPASCSNQQSTAQCSSSNATNGSGEDEILAWKMLEKAKSIKQGRQKSNVACRATKCPTIKLKALKEANDVRSRYIYPNKQRNGQNGVGNSGLGQSCNYLSHEKDHYKQQSPAFRKQESRNSTLKPDDYGYGGSITPHLPKPQKLASSKCTQTPSNLYNGNVRSERLPAEKSLERRACLTSSVGSEPVVSNTGHVEDIPSSSKVNNPKEKRQSVNICIGSKQYYDAKSEIQSLVKLNLKLQTKDEKLEVGVFKEVARLATHSILAACGLEQPKPDYCSFPDSICSHPSEVWQPQRCSLMPNSCRECFYVFVKDMVNTIMLEKKRMQQKNTVAY